MATGEAEVFKHIWEEREHFCTNCGEGLPEPPKAYYFAHVIRKGKDNSKRLDKNNIMLHCFKCHHELDNGTKEKYNQRKNTFKGISKN